MKTFDKKDVFTCANEENASSYIMKQGYFADDIKELKEAVVSKPLSHLIGIELDATYPFASNLGEKGTYRLFIPADKVKEVEEKKWRAFKDFNEFKFWTGKGVGSVIVYRDKLTNDELEAVITRSKLYENFVEIGAVEYTFKELFDQWEWLSNRNEWQPFGVLDES